MWGSAAVDESCWPMVDFLRARLVDRVDTSILIFFINQMA